jgi:hypothetical protein
MSGCKYGNLTCEQVERRRGRRFGIPPCKETAAGSELALDKELRQVRYSTVQCSAVQYRTVGQILIARRGSSLLHPLVR